MSLEESVEPRLAELLSDRPREFSELALDLRRLVARLAKHSSELLYQTYAVSDVFTFTGKMGQAFIHIAIYANHVNLGFNHGAKLADPTGLLEGTGKLIRHIRIDSMKTARNKAVRELILAAVEMGREMAEEKGGIAPQAFVDKTG